MKRIVAGVLGTLLPLALVQGAGASTLSLGRLSGAQHGIITVAVKNYTLTAGGRWCLTIDSASTDAASFIIAPRPGSKGAVRVVSAATCVTLGSAQFLSALRLTTTALANGTHTLALAGTSRHAGRPLTTTFRTLNTGSYVGAPRIIALPGVGGDTVLAAVSAVRVSRVVLHWGTPADQATVVMRRTSPTLFTVKLTKVVPHSYFTFVAVGSAGSTTVSSTPVIFLTPKG